MKKYIVFLIIGLVFTSCGIYRPNIVNVPLMENKGQAQLSSHISFNGYDCQGAYALTDKIALIANYNNLGIKREGTTTNYSIQKHAFAEIGAGCFKKGTKGKLIEFFFIAGNGVTSRFVTGGDTLAGNIPSFTNFRKAEYSRFLVQADIGKRFKKFEYAFSPRILFIHYYNIEDNSTDQFKELPTSYLYSDLALTGRFNFHKHFKISGQLGITIPITGYKAAYYEASPLNCGIGLIFDMNILKPIKAKNG